MNARSAILAIFFGIWGLGFPHSAAADGPGPLPSECITSKDQSCWSNADIKRVVEGLNADTHSASPPCPSQPAIAQLSDDFKTHVQAVLAKKYKHTFMVPQAQAAYLALTANQLANEYYACFESGGRANFPLESFWIGTLRQAVFWARASGSSTYFQQYRQNFVSSEHSVVQDSATDQWVREGVLYDMMLFCTLNDPQNGSEFPDYGRLFTWDNFHSSGCDGFTNVWMEPLRI